MQDKENIITSDYINYKAPDPLTVLKFDTIRSSQALLRANSINWGIKKAIKHSEPTELKNQAEFL